MLELRVDCYAGYRGEETPRRLTFGGHPIAVVEVLDRWLAPDHRYFKVKGDDGAIYIIRHDPIRQQWQLSGYKASPAVDRRALPETANHFPSTVC